MFVIIVGGGNTGSYLSKLLIDAGHKVRVIEERPSLLEKLRAEIPEDSIIPGDGSSPSVLEQAGILHANVLAAVTTNTPGRNNITSGVNIQLSSGCKNGCYRILAATRH